MLSTHKVEVVPVTLERHPNADTLSVAMIHGGYPVVVRTVDWQDGKLGAYIPPDSLVPLIREEFKFLDSGKGRTAERIRTKKIRGVQSFGLLVPAPEGSKEGDDVADLLGVTHYEPEIRPASTHGEAHPKISLEAAEGVPSILAWVKKYDIDALRRYRFLFQEGEQVQVTEKIHGANSRFCFTAGKIWCGSRTEWKKENDQNLWWRAFYGCPGIYEFCLAHPDHILYGEVYGNVQSLKYGARDEVWFAAFDVLSPDGSFWNPIKLRDTLETYGVPQVPLIGLMPFNFEDLCALAEGPSLVKTANHIREGVVVKPMEERFHHAVGRVILKLVGAGYLERN
jgi:RNA ligase (TIGR02306 family)